MSKVKTLRMTKESLAHLDERGSVGVGDSVDDFIAAVEAFVRRPPLRQVL